MGPTISTIPNQKYQRKEKKSQYKGVTWHKQKEKWYVQFKTKGEIKYGGYFNDELDAATKVNQLCEKLGIPLQNPEMVAMTNQKYQHDEYKTIENPVISCEILKTNNDDAAEKKEKNRKKELNDNNPLPVEI